MFCSVEKNSSCLAAALLILPALGSPYPALLTLSCINSYNSRFVHFSSFVQAHPEALQMPLVIDLSISLFKSQDEPCLDLQIHLLLLLQSFNLCLTANLHHAWLTASPVISIVGTCANRGWRIK